MHHFIAIWEFKLGFDLCDLDLGPLTLIFCMDVTSANNSWKLIPCWEHSEKSVTDRRTDERTDRLNHSESCWSQIKTTVKSQQWTGCEIRQITSNVWRPQFPLVTSRFRAWIPSVRVCTLLWISGYKSYRQQMVRTSTAGGTEVQQIIQDYMFTSYKIYMKLQNHSTNDISRMHCAFETLLRSLIMKNSNVATPLLG